MNFIIENFKKPKMILIVLGLTAIVVFSVMLLGYENYLKTLVLPYGQEATLYPDQSITASYVISDHGSWNLGNCCSSSPDISAGDYKNELALGYYCHHRDGEYTQLYRRITLRFDLSSLPSGTSINSAKLYLKPSKISYSQDVNIYGASNDNWEEANCFDPNQMKSCPQSAAAFQPGFLTFQDKVNINNINWKNWNVTNFVHSKQNSGSKYVTLHLVGSAENLTKCECDNCWDKCAINFWGPRSSQKPYLLINYSGTVQCYTDADCQSGYKCQSGDCVKIELDPTCDADGKCKTSGCPTGDPDCSCSQQGGNICQTDETCPGTSLRHNSSGTCCSVACAPAAIYSISGQITSSEDISSSRIAINLTGTSSASTATDSSGSYSFNNLANGSYAIIPSDGTWIISPTSQNATILSSNISGINFTAIKKECNLGETKKHICPDGTEVNWCTCDNYKWACIDSPENNCPATCGPDGKCKTDCQDQGGDPDCACAEQNGFICQADETCSGISLTHSGSEICCSVACAGSAVYQTADLNCDGSVNLTDSAILMSFWGKNNWPETDSCQSPDINQDGAVNLTDSAIMMSQWTEMTL